MTAAFADVFNDMEVWVYDENGQAINSKPLPVYLTPKEKVVAMIQRQGKSDTFPGGSAVDNYLPSITIVWRGIQLDTERMRGQREKRKLYIKYEDESEPIIHMDLQTVPYLLQYEVTVWAKYMDDAAQILENILPFFHPEAYISIYEKSIGSERKCKVTLDSVTPNFVYEMGQQERRVIQFNLGFTVECNFYKPELPIGKPITQIETRLGTATNKDLSEGEAVITKTEGTNTYVDFDDKLLSSIRNLTNDEAVKLADLGFNKVQSNSIENSVQSNEKTEDIIRTNTQTTSAMPRNLDEIIELAGLSVPISATQTEYNTILLQALYQLKELPSNPLNYGKLYINEEGHIILDPNNKYSGGK